MYKSNNNGILSYYSESPEFHFLENDRDYFKYVSLFEEFYFSHFSQKYISQLGEIQNALNIFLGNINVSVKRIFEDRVDYEIPQSLELENDFNIPLPSNSFDVLICTYVIEKFEHGPSPFLKEAKRLGINNGFIIMSFPNINKIRKFKSKLGYYKNNISNRFFFENAYTIEYISSIVNDLGMAVVEIVPNDVWTGATDEFGLFKWIENHPEKLRSFCENLFNDPFIFSFIAHKSIALIQIHK